MRKIVAAVDGFVRGRGVHTLMLTSGLVLLPLLGMVSLPSLSTPAQASTC